MDLAKLNESIIALIKTKSALKALNFNDERYDDIEDDLHELEDDFMTNFASYLEEALHDVHDEYCPDNDVLLPIAYVPSQAKITDDTYEVIEGEGVYVDVDDYEEVETKLLILPNPARLILSLGKGRNEVVWTAQ